MFTRTAHLSHYSNTPINFVDFNFILNVSQQTLHFQIRMQQIFIKTNIIVLCKKLFYKCATNVNTEINYQFEILVNTFPIKHGRRGILSSLHPRMFETRKLTISVDQNNIHIRII